MRFKKKDKQILLILSVLIIGLILGGTLLVSIPLTDYGDPDLWEETNDVQMAVDDILNVQDGDTLVAWLRENDNTQHHPTDLDWTVSLRRADTNEWIEDGGDASKVGELYPSVVGDNMRWWFNLESCHEGTFSYRVHWFAMIGDTEVDAGGYSFIFTVVNTEAPVYNDATFVTEPETEINYTIGQLAAYVTWKVHYDGAYVANVTVDGAEDWTNNYVSSTGDEMIMYMVDTSVSGTQSIILTITPDVADNSPLISDTVIVNIEMEDGNGDGDDDNGDDTDTTTTTPPPDEPEYDWAMIGVIAAVGVVIVYVLTNKKEGRR